MPEKLKPIEDIPIAILKPGQINMSTVVQIGPEQMVDRVSCDPCESCIRVGDSSGGSARPTTVAYDAVYERVAEATVEFGERSRRQERMIVEMEQGGVDQHKKKENLAEVGTSRIGEKRYLLKRPIDRREK